MAKEAKKIISENVRLQAFALFTMANNHYRKAREFEREMFKTLAVPDGYGGLFSDIIYDDSSSGDFDETLAADGYIVAKPKPAAKKRARS